MTTLHDLIQVGALKSALKPVSLDSYPGQIVSHSEFNSMGDAEKLSFKGLVRRPHSRRGLSGAQVQRRRRREKLAAADALSEELIGIIGSAKEDIGHLTAVQYAAEHFEDSFKAKLDVIGQL